MKITEELLKSIRERKGIIGVEVIGNKIIVEGPLHGAWQTHVHQQILKSIPTAQKSKKTVKRIYEVPENPTLDKISNAVSQFKWAKVQCIDLEENVTFLPWIGKADIVPFTTIDIHWSRTDKKSKKVEEHNELLIKFLCEAAPNYYFIRDMSWKTIPAIDNVTGYSSQDAAIKILKHIEKNNNGTYKLKCEFYPHPLYSGMEISDVTTLTKL